MGFIGSVPFRTVCLDITESLEIQDLNWLLTMQICYVCICIPAVLQSLAEVFEKAGDVTDQWLKPSELLPEQLSILKKREENIFLMEDFNLGDTCSQQ